MFTLRDYINALVSLLIKSQSDKERANIVRSWQDLIKKHYRDRESRKIIEIVDEEIQKSEQKAIVTVASQHDKERAVEILDIDQRLLEWNIDPEIIGGMKLVWKNALIDNSVKNQMEKFKANLIKGGE